MTHNFKKELPNTKKKSKEIPIEINTNGNLWRIKETLKLYTNVIIQNDQINKETNKWQTTILQNNTKNETSSSLPQKIKLEYENT